MVFQKTFYPKVSVALLLVPFLISCGSYHQKIQKYYGQLEAGRYNKAFGALDDIRYLKKPRNLFLYYAEKGRVAHLMGAYDTSNHFLNLADDYAEETRHKNAGDIAKGTLLNPMMQTYRSEPFERFMLNYYKALNYAALGKTEDALVEARRISLAENELGDATREKENRYSRNAFAMNVQGIIYEMARDYNNAFIAYRNAAETYLLNDDHSWYGVQLPSQLKADVIRTAELNGFSDLSEYFQKKFPDTRAAERQGVGELIVFIESGRAPVKLEENLMFTLVKGAGGMFTFTDPTGGFNIPFDVARYGNESDLGDLRTFRIALPKYAAVTQSFRPVTVKVNNQNLNSELAENINEVAFRTLQERKLKDITEALTRLAVKKMAEAAARSAGKSVAQNNSKEKDDKKKQENAEAVGDAVGLLFQAFSLLSEKADTRNWQSLPAYISYVRIPLSMGENIIEIQAPGRKTGTIRWTVEGKPGTFLLRSISLN